MADRVVGRPGRRPERRSVGGHWAAIREGGVSRWRWQDVAGGRLLGSDVGRFDGRSTRSSLPLLRHSLPPRMRELLTQPATHSLRTVGQLRSSRVPRQPWLIGSVRRFGDSRWQRAICVAPSMLSRGSPMTRIFWRSRRRSSTKPSSPSQSATSDDAAGRQEEKLDRVRDHAQEG